MYKGMNGLYNEFLGDDKMADNVMALVKKKGAQKKLRGKKAQVAKRRDAAARPTRVRDKRNPFRTFLNVDLSEMSDEIDIFIDQAGWTEERQAPDANQDREMIRMFNILKTGIPFPLVKTFFVEFDESDSFNVVHYFNEFTQRPDVRARIESMKELIRRRQAIRLNRRRQDVVMPEYSRAKIVDSCLRERIVSPTQRPMAMFGTSEILSQCEREYRRAPWMFPFTNHVIRGFALRDKNKFTIEQEEIKDGWYRVNMNWYKMSCEGKRMFIPGKVAYVTVNNDLIIETEDMYKASKRDWINEFTPLHVGGFEIAKRMIMNNDILKSTYSGAALEQYANTIIASFGHIKTNYDMARKLSYVLVFLSSLIDQPQIYHKMIMDKKYSGDVLINLDRYTLLPEIFKDPTKEKTDIENKIKRDRRSIENKYYELIKQTDPVVRKRMKPKRVEAPPRRSTNSEEVVSPVVRPIQVSGATTTIATPSSRRGMELAPGLFQRLREKITQMTPIYCNQCDAEVFAPPYTTIRRTERLIFCTKECFDRYDI